MKTEDSNKILSETEAGYDQMAEKFSGTRNFFWSDLEFIKDHVKEGDKVLDFGCGNGRLLEILKDKNMSYAGVDVSRKLIDLAKEKYPDFAGNFTKISGSDSLPFPDDFFNKVVSIAVFHHFPKKYAKEMAKELYRVMKKDGILIVTAWNLWQPKYRKYIFQNIMRKIFGKSDLDFFDCEIPFKDNSGEIFYRFHRAYDEKELAKLFFKAGFKIEKTSIVNGRNIIWIAKK